MSNTRDTCDVCGSDTFSEGRFSRGKLLCRECDSGCKPATAMPPTAAQAKQLALWLQPQVQQGGNRGG